MTTILTVGNSEGSRRCDAVCHKARPDTRCSCVCEGRYHAIGSSPDAQRQLAADVVEGKLGPELAQLARESLAKLAEAEARRAELVEHPCAGGCRGMAKGRARYCSSCASARRNELARERRAEDHRYAGVIAAHRRERTGQLAVPGAAELPELPERIRRRLEREAAAS